MPPVGPGGTSSEQTTKITPVQVDASTEAWPSEEPDSNEPTIAAAVPNVGFPAGEDATEWNRIRLARSRVITDVDDVVAAVTADHSAFEISECSRATTSGGTPAGATTPYHTLTS